MSLTGLRSSGARLLRVVRGNAVWTIGTLAPGETRTVRGSVVLTSSTLGIVRNTAIATASNAGVVVHQADVRVLAARRFAPPSRAEPLRRPSGRRLRHSRAAGPRGHRLTATAGARGWAPLNHDPREGPITDALPIGGPVDAGDRTHSHGPPSLDLVVLGTSARWPTPGPRRVGRRW